MIRIKKGLNIPLEGSPKGAPVSLTKPRTVGLVGSDYNGMKPTMLVDNGDQVKIGQPLFEDKKNQGVIFGATQTKRQIPVAFLGEVPLGRASFCPSPDTRVEPWEHPGTVLDAPYIPKLTV